ncbi:helix-turn-helix transcriptional regulator [Streptomyces albireticuli]|uniref:helix-turn-helix transcriptional regulator n=1 Tax=Streptomyces albireticuli TaxID=1940 RepID=UPI00367CAD02
MLDFYEDMTRTGVVMTDVLTQFKTIYMRQLEDHRLKVLDKQPEILATLERELLGAHSEVVLQGSGHVYTEALAPVCLSLLRRGIAVRIVVRSSTATLPQPAAKLRDLTAAGAEIRISPTLPISFALVDDSTAMFYAPPSRLTEDDAAGPRMVVAHSPLVNEVLRPVFDHYWNHSASVVFQGQKAAGRRGSGEPEPRESGPPAGAAAPAVSPAGRPRDKRQLALLRMLASGLTDQTISRHLGMHERTVRRKVAELAASLHAASRFQAGVNAAKAGWLDEDLDVAG